MNKSRTVVCVLCIGIALVGLTLGALFLQHKGAPFLQAVSSSRFCLEGDLVFFGDERNWGDHVVECHYGKNYRIEYSEKTFYMIDGQYYVEDEENGRILVSAPKEKQYQIEEVFDRASILSNNNFSDFQFCSTSHAEIPDPTTGNLILCELEEYRLDETESVLRLYFLENELYAIQAKENPSLFFYVSNFSPNIQRRFTLTVPA